MQEQRLINRMRKAWDRLKVAENRYNNSRTVETLFWFFGWAQTYERLRDQAPSHFEPAWENESI